MFYLTLIVCKYHKEKNNKIDRTYQPTHLGQHLISCTLKGPRSIPTPYSIITYNPQHHVNIYNSFSCIYVHFSKLLLENYVMLQGNLDFSKKI